MAEGDEEAEDASPVTAVTHTAIAMGWLRRPEFDTDSYDAWELPDGALRAVEKGRLPIILTYTGRPNGHVRGS